MQVRVEQNQVDVPLHVVQTALPQLVLFLGSLGLLHLTRQTTHTQEAVNRLSIGTNAELAAPLQPCHKFWALKCCITDCR